jgi:hypothetical protein
VVVLASLKYPLTLMIAISAIALSASIISVYVGPLEYKGSLTFAYAEGENPITKVVFTFDDEIGDSLLVVSAPAGWSWAQGGNVLSIGGGSLAPGDTLVVQVSFKHYVEPGERPFVGMGTTTAGESSTSLGSLSVTEMILLRIIYILEENKVVVGGGTVAILIVEIILTSRRKKPSIPVTPVGPTVTGGTVTRDPDGTGTKTATGEDEGLTPPEEPQIDTVSHTCELGYGWKHHESRISISPEGKTVTLSDDPLPMVANAFDRHYFLQNCTCPATGTVSTQVHPMMANISIEWEIESGPGEFIRLNDAKGSSSEFGEMVLYQPPDITDLEKVETVVMRVKAQHNDPTKDPYHEPAEAYVTMKIRRKTEEKEGTGGFKDPWWTAGDVEDRYEYEITVEEKPVINDPPPLDLALDCTPQKVWENATDISGSIAVAPKEVAYGDYARLSATGSDTDNLVIRCLAGESDMAMASSGSYGDLGCTEDSPEEILTVNDELQYIWSAEKGTFPHGPMGQDVIWQAPDEPGEVKIFLTIKDTGLQCTDDKYETRTKIMVNKLGIDLSKTPKGWLPDAAQGTIDITAMTYICREGKWRWPGRKKHIRLKFNKVSGEPGVCMNYPKKANKKPDLFFFEEKEEDDYLLLFDGALEGSEACPTTILTPEDNPQHEHHYIYAVKKERHFEATPIVRCEDYGAIGYYHAEANHCVEIPAKDLDEMHEDCREGSNEITIPRDENGNDIADSAAQDGRGANGKEDKDNKPVGDGHAGDGVTNYEEYRGFMIQGIRDVAVPLPMGGQMRIPIGAPRKHVRTSIKIKDVFIYDQDNIGVGYLNETQLNIHLLYDSELFNGTESRVINYNHGRNHGGIQHGLWLRNFDLPRAGLLGRSCGIRPGIGNGTPKVKSHVCIDVAENTRPGSHPTGLPCTIAHELCHGLNIWHHGSGGNHNCSGGGWINFPSNPQRKVTSGDTACFMRYERYADAWCHVTGPAGAHHPHFYNILTENADGSISERWADVPGTKLCSSARGTGLNDGGPGHRNDATKGDCKGQLRVKDW